MLTVCLGWCSAIGEACLGYVTLIIMQGDRELSGVQVIYGGIQFKALVTKKVGDLYYPVDNNYYRLA